MIDRARGWLVRYRPYLSLILAVVLLVWFLPGDDDDAVSTAAGDGTVDPTDTTRGLLEGGSGIPGQPVTGASGTVVGGAPAEGEATGSATTVAGARALPVPAVVGPDCDPATGRIKVPAITAPPCQAPFSGDNGGATYQGVTADKIKIVFFQPDVNAAVDAALTTAGANNTPPDQRATIRDYVDYFNAHYELFGRKVEVTFRQGSGAADDDAAAKADAIAIATQDRPFAVLNAPTSNAFAEELAARKILCVCTVSQPQELYERLNPFVGYLTLMASTQGYIQRAEYVGKRLANRPAKWAGTSDEVPLNLKPRVFGFMYFETADFAYRSGAQYFEKLLLDSYGTPLKVVLAYTGPPNLAATQEQARPFIQRMKNAGVTSIIFSGDPLSPAIFTQEATRQLYFPEWIITGSALVDTSVFARTYSQEQWAHAFGVSFLSARVPDEEGEAYRVHTWQHGRPPTADNQYAVLYAPVLATFTGFTMAGPNLTPQSFQQGLFRYPVTGRGRVSGATISYGNHGLWPFTDFTAYDDVTEVWWDRTASGEDEVGNPGVGLYRYVDGGRRYLPGEHPTTEPKAFSNAGSVTIYEHIPPNERPPNYPRPGS